MLLIFHFLWFLRLSWLKIIKPDRMQEMKTFCRGAKRSEHFFARKTSCLFCLQSWAQQMFHQWELRGKMWEREGTIVQMPRCPSYRKRHLYESALHGCWCHAANADGTRASLMGDHTQAEARCCVCTPCLSFFCSTPKCMWEPQSKPLSLFFFNFYYMRPWRLPKHSRVLTQRPTGWFLRGTSSANNGRQTCFTLVLLLHLAVPDMVKQ